MSYLFLAIAILAEVVGTSFLKAANGFTILVPSLVVVLSYTVAFYCLSISLRDISIGIAYAIWAGMGIVLISLSGYFFFQQSLSWQEIVGLALIISGVVIVKMGSLTV